ncbi:MAG: gliding motility-associated C-terminal domain-containing protein [Bacteroidia bacterium]|nr:gliding motility-associated C-terminal domain-containing protein [Bacteroidia bacterium]
MRPILFLLSLMLLISISTFGQIGLDTYSVTRTTGITYTSISGTGTAVTTWKNGGDIDNNLSTAITIPFSFPYDGGSHTSVLISLNGFLTFNTATNADGADIPACGTPEPYAWDNSNFTYTGTLGSSQAVAAFYNDLVCANAGALNSSIYYSTTGSAPNRIFTVQWTNMYNYIACNDNSCTETPGSLNFQIKLYETSGNIEFVYGPTMTQTTYSCGSGSCSVDETYTSGLNSNSISSTPTINQLITQQSANTSTFNNNASNNLTTLPAANSRITFTRTAPPAAVSLPSSVTNNFPANGATNQCLNTILSWKEGNDNPTGFDIYFGTAANPPLVVSNSPETYYNPGPLTINTTYYWKIVPRNAIGVGTSFTIYSFSTSYGDVQPTEILLSGIGFLESHVADGTDALGRPLYYNTYAVCRDEVGIGTLTPQNYYLSSGSSLNWTNPIIICGVLDALTCENALPNSDLFSGSCDVTSQTPAITLTALLAAIMSNALCPGEDPYIEYNVFTRGCNNNIGCTKVRFHILPDPEPGVVQNTGQTICSGGDPSVIGFSTLPDQNYGSFNYQWYSYNGNTSAPTGSSVPVGWNLIPGASGSNSVYYEPFLTAPTVPTGWAYTSIGVNSSCYGLNAPAAEFNATNDRVTTALYASPVTNLSFRYGATSYVIGATSSLRLEAWNGSSWVLVNNYTGLNGDIIFGCNALSGNFNFTLAQNYLQFRWTSTRPTFPLTGPILILDDVNITVGVLPTYDPPAGLGSTTTYACLINPISGSSGFCANTLWADQQWVVTVSPGPAAPAVTSPVNYCQNAVAGQLSATGSGLLWYTTATGGTGSGTAPTPSTTTVGTTSYWVSQTTTCEGPRAQITVNINSNVTPTFNSYGPYCVGATPASLPASSINGITGTWSPAAINTGSAGTSSYTFTPTAGLCATTATISVTINSSVTPTFTQLGPYCLGQSPDAFQLTSTNGITGTWSPTTINTSVNGTATYTFTPDGSTCAVSTTMDITTNSATANAGADQAICSGNSITLNASGGTSYSWSGGISQGVPFTPAGTGNLTYTVTVTDANLCTASDQVTVTVYTLPPADAGTDLLICPGGQATLNASGGTSYIWDNGVQQGIPFTPATTGTTTYTVTVTDANSCTAIDSVHVTMDNIVANAGTDQIICSGQTVTLTATGGDSYQWDNGVAQGVPFTPSGTLTYTVTVTVASACSATDQVQITVNPSPTADAGIDQAICLGNNVTLTATGGVLYSWSNGVLQGVAFTPSLSGNTTYTVTVTGANSCTSTDQVVVTANALPNADAGLPQTACIGQQISLTATGGNSYVWDNGVVQSVLFVPANIGITTYHVTVTDGNSCSAIDSVNVTVNNIIANAGNDQTVCFGQSVTLTATGGTTYNWDNSITQGIPFSPGVIGITTYTVTVTDANSCTATDQVDVTVNISPSANAGTDQNICIGQTVTLTATGGITYTWDNGILQGVLFTPSAIGTTTYTVTVTGANGCTATDQVLVNLNASPTPQITGTLTVCQGYTMNYSTTNINGHIYTWSITNGTPATATSATVAVTWGNSTTGTLHLTETIASASCSASDSEVVVIHETPVAIASNDATVCHGTGITINASSSTGTPPLYYTWNQSLGTGAVQNINPTVSTVYTVTVSNTDNCATVDSVVVTVYSIPQFSLASTNATCDDYKDGTATATITTATQPIALLWSNGATVANLTQIGVGVYYLTLTDGTGCATIDSVVVGSLDQFNCLEIPTLFSPNADGKNDKFEIKHINLYPLAKVEIYNRWGNLLYKSDNYANPSNWWDGTWKGKELPMGSYVFILTLSPDMDPIQGVVSIVK